jgi:hypothetical protein
MGPALERSAVSKNPGHSGAEDNPQITRNDRLLSLKKTLTASPIPGSLDT